MGQPTNGQKSMVVSYLTLRRGIGVLGFALPFVMLFGGKVFGQWEVQESICRYYYTDMRNGFVGMLCIIGFFLFSYRGYGRTDDTAGNVACVFALLVAFMPPSPESGATKSQSIAGGIHLVSAFGFLCTLAYFSLLLFTKTDPSHAPTKEKRQRNLIYRICGWTIVGAVALLCLYVLMLRNLIGSQFERFNPVFCLETLAVAAFGFSWIVKGEMIAKDALGPGT